MGININWAIPALMLLIAAVWIIQPVLADEGSVSIAYRGSGGAYIGDTVIFDGRNTVGNVTLLTITGPGLPAAGVPVLDLNGAPGSGNTVQSDPDGTWKFVWYMSLTKGIEKLQTARYSITASALGAPGKSSVTSVMMKRPDFYVTVSPDTVETGEYIQLIGTVEHNTNDAQIQITDGEGKVFHTYDVTISSLGYFNYGLHIDMPPGDYVVTLTSPTVTNPYRTALHVVPPQTFAPEATGSPGTTTAPVSVTPALSGSGTGSISLASTPPGASVSVDSVMMGQTPLNLPNISAGNHKVELKIGGYQPYSAQVTVKAGETVTVAPALLKNASPIPLPVLVPVLGVLVSAALVIALSVRRDRR